MSAELKHIRAMLKNNWDGSMWYGTNLSSVLKDINAEKAFQKPTAGSHNIYELAAHLLCWRTFVIEMLKGNAGYKVEINSEQDWPTAYQPTDISWNEALNHLEKSQTELMNLLNAFDESKLGELVEGRDFKYHVLLNGVLHHDIYHSGQISILKNLVSQ